MTGFTAETGHFALALALCAAIAQAAGPLLTAHLAARDGGPHPRAMALTRLGDGAARAQLLCLAVAFAALTRAYVASDFSLLNVAENSHTLKPLLYKISGVWGNHEGSLLLWVLILALSGALMTAPGMRPPDILRARALAVQGMVGAGFLLFMLLTSNPFARLHPAPIEGLGLNPLLQDPGLARTHHFYTSGTWGCRWDSAWRRRADRRAGG